VNVEEAADGTVIVSYDGLWLTKVMLAFAALFLITAGYDVFFSARGTGRLLGLLASAVTCLLVAIVFLETASFRFGRAMKTITWRRRWGLRERSGSIPFASIQAVVVERPTGDEGTPSRRITLKTSDGAIIPITAGYRPDADGSIVQIAGRIRALLGHDPAQTHHSPIEALVAAGKVVEAIKVLREEERLTLVEAKQRVDALMRPPKP
jgi:hypothetical protein